MRLSSKSENSSDVECRDPAAGEVAAQKGITGLHQEASAELGETGKLRRGGETGTVQAPAVQGETAGLRRETEAQGAEETQAEPGETSELRREDEMQAGEG